MMTFPDIPTNVTELECRMDFF